MASGLAKIPARAIVIAALAKSGVGWDLVTTLPVFVEASACACADVTSFTTTSWPRKAFQTVLYTRFMCNCPAIFFGYGISQAPLSD